MSSVPAKLLSAHLAAIVDSSDDAIITKDLNGIIQSWNSAAERIFGYTALEAVGQSIRLIVPEDRQAEEDMILSQIAAGKRIDHFETVRQRKDGRLIEISATIFPIRDEKGVITGASNVARDVSERAATDLVNARLAAIVQSSDDAIVSKDLNGIVQSWNRGAERLFGYLAEEIIGKPILMILPKGREDEETQILRRIRAGERIDHFETIRVRKDGKPVEVSVTISPIKDWSGKIVGASKVARDISDRRVLEESARNFALQLERRVQERTAELEEAHQEMEGFTYSVAHDLRGPLRAIISTSAILLKEHSSQIDPEGIQLLERQQLSGHRLAQLIEDLLNYSRLGKNRVKKQRVNLSDLAQGIAREYRDSNCSFVIQPNLEACVDPSLAGLMLRNLFDNGVKFSPEGGEVEFGKTPASFFVRDHGVGFDMAYAEKIFIPFERLVRNDEIAGTGIGLANVKRIIAKHGGTIWVNSVVGEGTTFYFTLPAPEPC